MAYTDTNYKNKSELKADVKAGKQVHCYKPNDMFGDGSVPDGETVIEGPHYPQPHRWYARVQVKGGMIVKVLG